jgi:hypothetical protein
MHRVEIVTHTATAKKGGLVPRVGLLLCFLAIAGCLAVRDTGGLGTTGLTSTIYPWWLWVLVFLGSVAAVASIVLLSDGGVQAGAFAVSAIAAAQLCASGMVAFKHWKPASGMGGTYGGRLGTVEDLALVIGGVGLLAVLISLWVLIRQGDLPQRKSAALRTVAVVAGLIVAIGLPIGLSTGPDMGDLTSWGAVSLIYFWPWGVALIAVGWASRTTGLTAAATVCVSAALAVAGPQMTDLVFGTPAPFFGTALVLAVVVLLARRAARA